MKRWLPFLSVVLTLPLSLSVTFARPSTQDRPILETPDLSGSPAQSAGVFSLSSGSSLDTVWYDGTRWAADSLRWEGPAPFRGRVRAVSRRSAHPSPPRDRTQQPAGR